MSQETTLYPIGSCIKAFDHSTALAALLPTAIFENKLKAMASEKTMKAARFHPDTKKVQVDNIPVPKPDDDLMLVRTIGSGLCHSEMVRNRFSNLYIGARIANEFHS